MCIVAYSIHTLDSGVLEKPHSETAFCLAYAYLLSLARKGKMYNVDLFEYSKRFTVLLLLNTSGPASASVLLNLSTGT